MWLWAWCVCVCVWDSDYSSPWGMGGYGLFEIYGMPSLLIHKLGWEKYVVKLKELLLWLFDSAREVMKSQTGRERTL